MPGMLLDPLIDTPDRSGALTGDTADVRDTADPHIVALEHPDVGRERALVRSSECLVPNPSIFTNRVFVHPVQRHLHGKMTMTHSTAPNSQT